MNLKMSVSLNLVWKIVQGKGTNLRYQGKWPSVKQTYHKAEVYKKTLLINIFSAMYHAIPLINEIIASSQNNDLRQNVNHG